MFFTSHCIPFCYLSPITQEPREFPSYSSGSLKAQALQEVDKLQEKGALKIVQDRVPAFYNRLFLEEKALGRWRPMIDLSPLNTFVAFSKLRMET